MNLISVVIVVLIILKIAGLISLSWWWILSPIWIPLLFLFTLRMMASR
jgi:hypothetical protein